MVRLPGMDELPLERHYLHVSGQPVLSLLEYQAYAYGIPEDAVVPDTMLRWLVEGEADAAELANCLRGDATRAAGVSDEALEIVRTALERLQPLLPE
jgi:hypothetical protein